MPVSISWALNIQVSKGPNMAISSHLEVHAYDKIDVTIDSGVTDKAVELQPGGADRVHILLIRSNVYGDGLTYKVNDAGNPTHALNNFLLLVEGGVALLGFPPNTLLFSNSLGQNAVIEILIGREAMD